MENIRVYDLSVQCFANWVHKTELFRLNNFFGPGKPLTYPQYEKEAEVHIRPGKRWIKVDVGSSGRYMIDTDGLIYPIKSAYGVPNLKKRIGSIYDSKWRD